MDWSVFVGVLRLNLKPNVIDCYYTALLSAVERSVHLHGPDRLLVVNHFSIMTVAQHIMTYHSASSPITYQPRPIRLLSDVNVFGGLFLCGSTLRMRVTDQL